MTRTGYATLVNYYQFIQNHQPAITLFLGAKLRVSSKKQRFETFRISEYMVKGNIQVHTIGRHKQRLDFLADLDIRIHGQSPLIDYTYSINGAMEQWDSVSTSVDASTLKTVTYTVKQPVSKFSSLGFAKRYLSHYVRTLIIISDHGFLAKTKINYLS